MGKSSVLVDGKWLVKKKILHSGPMGHIKSGIFVETGDKVKVLFEGLAKPIFLLL